jgi:transposase
MVAIFTNRPGRAARFFGIFGKLAQLKGHRVTKVNAMDGIATLKEDALRGRISAERLVDLLATQQRLLHATQQQLHTTQQQLQAATQRIAELEKQGGGTPTAKVDEPFSLRAEEQRQQARGQRKPKRKKKGRRGRGRTQDKIAQAERTEAVFPEGVPPKACHLSHVRPVWRLEQGRAVLVAYQVYRGPHNRYGVIPGVLGRSEFGLEIVTEIAYLVYLVGLSFDKVCMLLQFFQNLQLRKSQADALLYRLARHWQQEFETLCTLLAHSLVVHTDETRWSVHSVWAFLSEQARVLLFGVPKEAATLKVMLDPATFAGLVISDDAAVYENFTTAQKCWAHLLRKAIKLTLQDPNHAGYRDFTDALLEVYRQAVRSQRDGRLGDAGRARKVADLDETIVKLCLPMCLQEAAALHGLDHEFCLLVKEVFRLMIKQELFQFVTAAPQPQPNGVSHPVGGTNNEAERTLRGAAQARTTGRTNKTLQGARRQTILTSVLDSLRLYLKTFTLTSVLAELQRWWAIGHSCFTTLLHKLKLRVPAQPIINQLIPHPSPSG